MDCDNGLWIKTRLWNNILFNNYLWNISSVCDTESLGDTIRDIIVSLSWSFHSSGEKYKLTSRYVSSCQVLILLKDK